MFAEQRSDPKKGKAHDDKAAPLVLQDTRPAGMYTCMLCTHVYECLPVFLAVLEFIYSNSCKLNQGIVRTRVRPVHALMARASRSSMCWRRVSSTGWTASSKPVSSSSRRTSQWKQRLRPSRHDITFVLICNA